MPSLSPDPLDEELPDSKPEGPVVPEIPVVPEEPEEPEVPKEPIEPGVPTKKSNVRTVILLNGLAVIIAALLAWYNNS